MSTAYAVFSAYGVPQPKGSTRSFLRGGRIVTTSDNPKLKGWQRTIAQSAKAAYPRTTFPGPVSVTAVFHLPRPKAAKGRQFHTVRPDVDKLLRAVNDALTGVLWVDDCMVVELEGRKVYVEDDAEPGVQIVVTEVDR
jgi:Holliday junction resolvase RusA-like endonuclease